MYNYESTPPEGVWNDIVKELPGQEAKIFSIRKKRNYTFYYLAAASVAIILFCVLFFTNRSTAPGKERLTTSSGSTSDTAVNNSFIITVPVEEKNIAINGPHKNHKEGRDQKQGRLNNNDSKANITVDNPTRYITIEGPQGQPVKISSKMATLIDSSETTTRTKPIWNKKINEWREIMKVNTLAPTTGNFLDIVELTKTLRDNKQP